MSTFKEVFDQITEDRKKRGNGTAQNTGTTNPSSSNLEKAMERIQRQREAEQERKRREEEAAAREEQPRQEPAEPERQPQPIPAVVPEQAEGAAQASRDLLQRQRTMAAYDRDTRNALPQEAVNKAMAAKAKEEYENYLASDEYKQETVVRGAVIRAAASADAASNEAEYYAAMAGKGIQTDKEKELKARADYYEAQVEADEDKAVMERDLAELETWPAEDQQALKTYLSDLPTVGINTSNARELIRKYGREKVREMAESLSRSQNAQLTAQAERNAREKAGSGIGGAIGQSAASVLAGIVGAVGGPVAALGDLMHRTGRYNTLDPNNNQANTYAGAVREQVAQDIAGDGSNPLRKGLSYAYQGGMSALDSGARLLASGGNPAVALGLAASGSFGQTVSEASKQGASPVEALGHGAVSAGIEALTEKLPLDELVKTAKGGGKGVTQAITAALKQAGIEATTEEISLMGSLASEAAILREKSSYNQRIGELVTGGMSYQEAKQQADREILEQAKQTAIVSGMSGGMSSLGASAGANLSDRLGGPQTDATAQGETAQDTAETGHQAFLNRMLQGIQPKQQEAEAPKTEGEQRLDAAIRETMGNNEKTAPEGGEVVRKTMGIGAGVTDPEAETSANARVGTDMNKKPGSIATPEPVQADSFIPKAAGGTAPSEDVTQVPAGGQMANHETNARSALASPSPELSVSNGEGNVNAENAPLDSPEGFEAMGAASYGFNPFSRMQNEYGNIPDGENAVRPDDMPVSTNGMDRVSYTARTVKGAAATPEEFIGDLENLVVKGGMSYIPITNDATAQAAAESIRRLGWEESLTEWRAKVRSGKAGPDMTATGAILLNNAANAGDKQTWLSILDDYRKLGTNTAQGLQAFRILKKLAPEDKLYLIRKSVNQMVEEMHLDGEITLDEDLEKAYREAETEEARDKALLEIQKDVAAQIPSTAMDKWTALRYMNMLGNFRTQVRNIAGNIGAQSAYRVKDTIAASIEAVVNKASGGKLGRTKSVTVGRGLLKAAAKDFDAMQGAILDGGKYADSASESSDFIRGVQEQRTIFKSDNKALDTLMKPMEGYRRVTNWAMNNGVFGDAAFGRAAYARAMAGYLKANGVKGDSLENVDGKLLDKARAYAAKEAQEATFRDNNAVSDWISKVGRRKDTPKAAKVIAEGIMPFRKTPANVLVRAEEFSPLGLINATVKTVQAAKGGEVTGTDVVNSWAKALTGTGLTILGAALGNAGLLIGGPDEDEDEAAFDDLNGYQNYALQLPDGTNLTIDFLSPVAMPLFLGAQIQKIAAEGGYQLADLEGVFLSLADPLIQMSMLQGVNDTLDNIKYSENNMGQFLLNAATSYLTQGITNTLFGQLERASEDVRMTTYVDKDSQLSPWVQRQIGKASQKIPGIDYQQMPYRNAWGETEKNPEGVKDYLYNLLSPSYISKGKTDDLAKELKRLNEVQSDVNVFPDTPETKLTYTDKDGNLHEDYNLSQEQWQTMAETEGKTQNRIAKALTESADYKALTDDQKAKAISLCYEYAREKGRVAAIEDYPGMSESWMEGAEGDEAASIIRKVALGGITDGIDTLKEAWRKGYDTGELMQDLEKAYEVYTGLSYETRTAVLENATGAVKSYIEERESGSTTEEYTKIQMPTLLLGDGMDALSTAIKEGADTSAALSDLEEVYALYSKLEPLDKRAVLEKVSTKAEYYLKARSTNVSGDTFAQLYKTFTGIDNTDAGEFDKAETWAHALQKAKEAGRINQSQVDKLKDSMRFWQIIPAEADQYNNLVDNGVKADTANKVMNLLDGIVGTGTKNKETGKATVRDVDKWEELSEAGFLSESEKDNIIKLYMPDYDPTAKQPDKTELKYDYARQELGISAEDYMDAYRVQVDYSKKDEKMAAWKALGFTDEEAENLWLLFGATGSNKIDVVAWYEGK